MKMFIHEVEKKKKQTALVSSRVGTIGIFTADQCPNACRNSKMLEMYQHSHATYHFFFYFYCENFIFNIPINIDR